MGFRMGNGVCAMMGNTGTVQAWARGTGKQDGEEQQGGGRGVDREGPLCTLSPAGNTASRSYSGPRSHTHPPEAFPQAADPPRNALCQDLLPFSLGTEQHLQVSSLSELTPCHSLFSENRRILPSSGWETKGIQCRNVWRSKDLALELDVSSHLGLTDSSCVILDKSCDLSEPQSE